ncbi:hypothetical protein AB205_0156520 [Aquarana catesbeiana]|uniref:Uncharacterized protein n=1 Tax=Aquarana catesbeiana TaxID=8400 RepID=A0A2G9R6N9_AQUCT|nr:hypothetical protein AB205_0156520 [Aquarana catesbeiana]
MYQSNPLFSNCSTLKYLFTDFLSNAWLINIDCQINLLITIWSL